MRKYIPSLSTYKLSNSPCLKHPTQTIHSLCLHRACSAPSICVQCESAHPKDHAGFFQSISSLYNDKALTQYNKVLSSGFSSQSIGSAKDQIFMILQNTEDEFRGIISKMKEIVEEGFEKLKSEAERRKSMLKTFEQMKNVRKSCFNDEYFKELLRTYKLVKLECNDLLDMNLENLTSAIKKDVTLILDKAQNELSSNLKASISFGTTDFSKLQVRETFQIPWSNGVASTALAYIDKWDILAFACRDGQKYSVGLYDITFKRLLANIRGICNDWIVSVIWVDPKNYMVTGSKDSTVRVFRVSDHGNTLQAVYTLRGHTLSVGSLKYINNENMLISAGYDADIKVWSLGNFRRCGTICTASKSNMNGSIAYIEADKLIGVAFQAGYIRFYHLWKRNCVLQLNTEGLNRFGLRYLPKKSILITTSYSSRLFKIWQYSKGENKVTQEEIIANKNAPFYAVASEDESQILYYVSKGGRQGLEMYSFITSKTRIFELSPKIRSCNCLISLGTKGVLIGDSQSGNICILRSTMNDKN